LQVVVVVLEITAAAAVAVDTVLQSVLQAAAVVPNLN
jgi:hypothetical protein